MTLPVIFHELAENELNEAATFYAQARPGLEHRSVRILDHFDHLPEEIDSPLSP